MWASSIKAGYFPHENRMKDDENFLLQQDQYTYRGYPPDSCVRVLEEGLIIGRKTSDMNSVQSEGPLEDFTYNGHKVAWFSTAEFGDRSIKVLSEANELPNMKPYDQNDDLKTCLSDYKGHAKYYKLNSQIRLWDMSKREALDLIQQELNEVGKKIFASCFRWNEKFGQVVRHSDENLDIELCKILIDNDIINSIFPGWYHPTMLAFNKDNLNIEKIHRREIVLLNPLNFIGHTISETGTPKRLNVSSDEGDYNAPKKDRRRPRDGGPVRTLF
jgi:hypothetical protein